MVIAEKKLYFYIILLSFSKMKNTLMTVLQVMKYLGSFFYFLN